MCPHPCSRSNSRSCASRTRRLPYPSRARNSVEQPFHERDISSNSSASHLIRNVAFRLRPPASAESHAEADALEGCAARHREGKDTVEDLANVASGRVAHLARWRKSSHDGLRELESSRRLELADGNAADVLVDVQPSRASSSSADFFLDVSRVQRRELPAGPELAERPKVMLGLMLAAPGSP